MGKERKLEKKIKELEEAVSSINGSSTIAERVMAAMAAEEVAPTTVSMTAPAVAAAEGGIAAGKEKKSKKKRPRKSPENAHPQGGVTGEIVPEDEYSPTLVALMKDAAEVQQVSAPPSSVISDFTLPSLPIEIRSQAPAAAEEHEPEQAEPEQATPLVAPAPLPLERRVEIIGDTLYELMTDQLVTLRVLRESLATIVSSDCQRVCDAKLRKRARATSAAGTTPKRRKLTGFQLFCQGKRQELTPPAKHSVSELARLWKDLSEEERTKYRESADKLAEPTAAELSDAN